MNLLLTRTKHEDLKLNSVNRNGHGHILMVGFSCSPLEAVCHVHRIIILVLAQRRTLTLCEPA